VGSEDSLKRRDARAGASGGACLLWVTGGSGDWGRVGGAGERRGRREALSGLHMARLPLTRFWRVSSKFTVFCALDF